MRWSNNIVVFYFIVGAQIFHLSCEEEEGSESSRASTAGIQQADEEDLDNQTSEASTPASDEIEQDDENPNSTDGIPHRVPSPFGIKQIHSGHSLTDNAAFNGTWPGHYASLIEWADPTVSAYDTVGKSTIPGSPLLWRWEHAPGFGSPDARGDIADWELLILTERVPLSLWDGTEPGSVWYTEHLDWMRTWVEHAWQNGHNGNGTPTLLYATWTGLENGEVVWRSQLDLYKPLWEQLADYATVNLPESARVYIIPANLLMMRLYDDIAQSSVPGVTSIHDFFSDDIHTNGLGAYSLALIHLAVIHHLDPRGIPYTGFGLSPEPSAELASYLQEVVWQIVRSYGYAGVPN